MPKQETCSALASSTPASRQSARASRPRPARAEEPAARSGDADASRSQRCPAAPTVCANASTSTSRRADAPPRWRHGTAATEAGDAAAARRAEPRAAPIGPACSARSTTHHAAQIWDGPPIDDVKGWENDEKISELTTYLESRRIPIDDAEKAIKEYAESLPAAERDKKLTELFASVLSKINSDRQFVIGRVEEFQRRQKARADELEREGRKLAESNQQIPADEELGPRDAKLTPEQQEYNWNARIFQERQQNLTVACDIPILIEQRAYEIGKLIRAQMSS